MFMTEKQNTADLDRDFDRCVRGWIWPSLGHLAIRLMPISSTLLAGYFLK